MSSSRLVLGLGVVCAFAAVRCVSDDSGAFDAGNDAAQGQDVTVQEAGSDGSDGSVVVDGAADVEADAPRPVPTPVGDFDWAAGVDGVGGGPVAYDAQGNLYFSWQIYYDTTFNGTSYTSAGTWDVLLVKFDPKGKVLWARQYGGTGSDQITALTTDPTGDVYATFLTASPTLSFGNGVTYTKQGSNYDGFVVRLKGSNGDGVWLADYSKSNENFLACRNIAYGGGRLGLECSAYQGMTLTKTDNSPLTLSCLECGGANPQMQNIYVVSLDPSDGKAYWGNVIAANASTVATSLAVDSKGAVVMDFGSFGDVVHDPTNSVNWSYQGVRGAVALVVKLAGTNGAGIWFKQFTDGTTNNANQTSAGGIAVDSNDDVILGGSMYGQVPFGVVTLKSAGQSDGFVAKLKSGFGDVIWAQTFGGSLNETETSVGVDAWNEVFVADECMSADGKLGTFSFPAEQNSYEGICFGKLDPNGTALWATGVVSSSTNIGIWPDNAVAVDPSAGDVTIQGGYQGTVDLGDGNPLTNKSAQELEFVVTHNP